MKIMRNFLILCLAMTMSLGTYAQLTVSHVENTAVVNDSEREIAMKDAPMLVQNAIKSDAYAGWEAKKVMHIMKDGKEYYKVKFKKGEEKMYQKFNKDGTLKAKKDWKKSDKKMDKSS